MVGARSSVFHDLPPMMVCVGSPAKAIKPRASAWVLTSLLQVEWVIRSSELRFYQKVRNLLALSSNYNPSDKATQMCFAEMKNMSPH